MFGPQDECNRTVGEMAVDRANKGGGRRDIQHLQLFGPQVECNRTVEEIAVDRAGEDAEEILNTYNNWIQEAISKSCSILTSQTYSNIGYYI